MPFGSLFRRHNKPEVIDNTTPTHIVFVVFGIGQETKHITNAEMLQLNINQSISQYFTGDDESLDSIKLIPISWHNAIHSDKESWLAALRIGSEDPSQLGLWRTVSENLCLDVVLWCLQRHRQQIVAWVTRRMCEAYSNILMDFPDFKGKVSVLGHSQGAQIAHYILSRQCKPETPIEDAFNREGNMIHLIDHLLDNNVEPMFCHSLSESVTVPPLPFHIHTFISMGTALSMMMNLEEEVIPHKCIRVPVCANWYSLLNKEDALAYRIEPLFDGKYVPMNPVVCYNPSTASSRFSTFAKRFMNKADIEIADIPVTAEENTSPKFSISSSSEDGVDYTAACDLDDEEEGQTSSVKRIVHQSPHDNDLNCRFDYVIEQRSFSRVIDGLKSHTSYWGSRPASIFLAEAFTT
ncbi:hypothetical protein P9112_010609 [Eukaryota sp. TZLM1-RC]